MIFEDISKVLREFGSYICKPLVFESISSVLSNKTTVKMTHRTKTNEVWLFIISRTSISIQKIHPDPFKIIPYICTDEINEVQEPNSFEPESSNYNKNPVPLFKVSKKNN